MARPPVGNLLYLSFSGCAGLSHSVLRAQIADGQHEKRWRRYIAMVGPGGSMSAFFSEIAFWGLVIVLCVGVSVALLAAMYRGGQGVAELLDRAPQDKMSRNGTNYRQIGWGRTFFFGTFLTGLGWIEATCPGQSSGLFLTFRNYTLKGGRYDEKRPVSSPGSCARGSAVFAGVATIGPSTGAWWPQSLRSG